MYFCCFDYLMLNKTNKDTETLIMRYLNIADGV